VRVLLLSALLGVAACQPEPVPPPPPGSLDKTGEVLVTIDGETVTSDMVDAVTRRIAPEQLAEMTANPAQHRELLERIAIGQLLYRKAIEQELHLDPEVQSTLAMTAREVLASEVLEKVGAEAVTDANLQKFYDEHKVQFARPSVKLQHMIVADAAQAKDIADQLRNGADFAALAKQFSLDGGQNGGDLGWVEKGRLIADLENPAFAAPIGEVVGPVQSEHGQHVMRVTERRETTPLEDVRPQIEERLKREAVEAYLAKLKEEAKIEYPDETPAPPSGASLEIPTDRPPVPPAHDGPPAAPPAAPH
jgi:parvulin-like peptidyl-prolyl isomerase